MTSFDDQKSFAEMRHDQRRNLLLEIARCPNVTDCLEERVKDHPCSGVVKAQDCGNHHIPEPWSGDLSAPILFLSSNPAFDCEEDYPTPDWPDDHIADFFESRFRGGRKEWIDDGLQTLNKSGGRRKGSGGYGQQVRNRASELLDRPAQPGKDYALTEVVHCKSSGERGVATALDECTNRYLRRVLAVAHAQVIVVLGRTAEWAVRSKFDITDSLGISGPVTIAGRRRHIAFLPHPNARKARTFASCMPAELERLRSVLRRQP